MLKKAKPYLISIAIALGVGLLSSFFTRDAMTRFDTLKKPPLAPPGSVFPIVWSVLFVLMGISIVLFLKSGGIDKKAGLLLYTAQLVVNFFWTIFFFNLEWRLFSFFWLLLLLGLVIGMIVKFSKDSKPAAYLQIPYVLWLLFAGYLNLGVYLLNRA